jgi:hypothetical protein
MATDATRKKLPILYGTTIPDDRSGFHKTRSSPGLDDVIFEFLRQFQ